MMTFRQPRYPRPVEMDSARPRSSTYSRVPRLTLATAPTAALMRERRLLLALADEPASAARLADVDAELRSRIAVAKRTRIR